MQQVAKDSLDADFKKEYIAINQGAKESFQIWQFINKLLSNKTVKTMNMLRDNATSRTLARDLKSQN